jgi:predicted metal-dependent hydrolase
MALNLSLGDETPTCWFADNLFLTHFMNAFSGILPQGEHFMIESVRASREQVRADRELQKQISGFIGQEAYHSIAHERFNALLAARGFPIGRQEVFTAQVLQLVGDLPDTYRMAVTGAVEHFTAMFGKLVLSHPEIIEAVHPTLRPMFIWHALEELEHKAVAFDLCQASDGNYPRRVAGLFIATAAVTACVAYGQFHFMRKDRSMLDGRAAASGLWWMFGFGKKAGYFRKMLPDYLAFFRPGFHPWQDDSQTLIARWKPELQRLLAE